MRIRSKPTHRISLYRTWHWQQTNILRFPYQVQHLSNDCQVVMALPERFRYYRRLICAGMNDRWEALPHRQSERTNIQNGVNQNVNPMLFCYLASLEKFIPRSPSCFQLAFMFKFSQVPLNTASAWQVINIDVMTDQIIGIITTSFLTGLCIIDRSQRYRKSWATRTASAGLLGGGNQTWVKPNSAKRGISVSKCFHQLIDSWRQSQVKNCNYGRVFSWVWATVK